MGVSIWQLTLLAAAVGLYLVFPISSAIVARNKGRSAVGWFFLGLIFPFAILFVTVAPPSPSNAENSARSTKQRG